MNAMNEHAPSTANRSADVRVAYLVNQYPKVSHTFIRREIAALEQQGVAVERFSIRATQEPLPDDDDREEQGRTRPLLAGGIAALGASLLRATGRAPQSMLSTAALAAELGHRSGGRLMRHGAYLAEACRLRELVRAAGIKHVHAHFGTNSATVAMLCHRLGGPPFSFTVHGPEEFDCADSLALDEKIRAAAFVIAISDFGRAQLWRRCAASSWDKIHVVRCGVDHSFLRAAATPVPAAARLVCVGRLCEQKGQLVLLQAAAALKRAGMDFQLTFVGDGPMRDLLERRARAEGLADVVVFAGWQSSEQVRRHITSARALVLPSFAEGLPVVIMEALALSRPVLSTYVAGIPELVKPDHNGWLVPAGDVAALHRCMREALTAPPEHLQALGRNGQRDVERQHDIEANARLLRGLFAAEARP